MEDRWWTTAAENHPSAVSTDECDCCCFGKWEFRMLAIDTREHSKRG